MNFNKSENRKKIISNWWKEMSLADSFLLLDRLFQKGAGKEEIKHEAQFCDSKRPGRHAADRV